MRRRPLLAAVAAGVAATLAVVPVLAADPEAALVNEELVVAQVDASGLPVEATLYSRLVARDFPVGQVRDPSSTTEVTYIDRRGAPATDGDAVLLDIGGNGQTSVTTRATFDKPLPVALHAEYRQGPKIVAPDDVPDTTGQMRIVYTVTNTTASEQTIRYRDAAGRWTVEKQPVFAPFVGTMVATLPQGLTLIEAPKAVRNTTEEGRTQLQWNLVLYPPIGDFQQSVQMLVSGDPLEVPGLTMQVIPVQSGQSPQLGFSTDLLESSVKGSADLADGLVQLDKSAVALAQGAGDLSSGLRQLGQGTSVLSQEVNNQLVPGSQQLAEGADKLAKGQSDAAKGTSKLAKGQQDAADGTEAAYDGAKSLEKGAAQLSDGLLSLYDGLQELLKPTALPSARDSADQLAQAVLRLRDVIGEPTDPTVAFPPTQANSLLQALRATQRTSGLTAAGAAKVTGTLKDIAKELAGLAALSAQAATLAGSAEAQTALVYQQACVDAVVLTPAQCAALQQATTDAGQARQQATDVGVGVGQQAARTGAQALAVGVIATSLQAITAALVAIDAGLTQVSLALVSGSTQTPGVYEGLQALTDGLSATIDGLVALSNGTAESAGGAQEITAATGDLTDGLGELADGAEQLADGADDLATGSADLAEGGRAVADGTAAQAQGTAAVGGALSDVNSGVNDAAGGAEQIADGADQLQQQGTSDALAGVIEASKQPAFAKAYLAATQARAEDALPYGAPEGAQGRVAYVYTMPGSGTRGSTGTLAGWGLLAVIAAAAGAVAWRRLHPVGEASEDSPGAAAEEEVPGAEQVALTPPPGASPPDDDWPFRP
jgi:putative membrane protein